MRKEEIELDENSYDLYMESLNYSTVKTNEVIGNTFESPYITYQDSSYIPNTNSSYSVYSKGKIVAYAEIKLFNFETNQLFPYKQPFGLIILDIEFKNKWINDYLVKRMQEDYQDNTEGFLILANPILINASQLSNLYPVKELLPTKHIRATNAVTVVDKLNLDSDLHLKLFENYAQYWLTNKKIAISPYGLELYYTFLYSELGLKDNIYYFPELSAIAIAKHIGRTLYLYDVFSIVEIDLDIVIKSLSNIFTNQVVLGFSPKTEGYTYTEYKKSALTLFAPLELVTLIEKNHLMLPILSHL